MKQLGFEQKIIDCADSSNKEWKEEATRYAHLLAERRQTFTSEMILVYLERNGFKTKDNRALGAILQAMVRNKEIKPLGYTQAQRKERHNAPVRVWESQIVKEPL